MAKVGNLSEKLASICGLMAWHTPQFVPPNNINIAFFSFFFTTPPPPPFYWIVRQQNVRDLDELF
jgi:hypothetical protein